MTTVSRVSRALSYLYLAFVLATQALVIGALAVAKNEFNLLPLIVATVLMAAGVFCYFLLPKYKDWALLAVIAAAIVFVIVALQLADMFPRHVDRNGDLAGVYGWRLIWAHLSPALMPLFMIPYWFGYRRRLREEQKAASDAAPDTYLGVPVNGEEPPRHQKRSVRNRNKT